MKITVTAEVMDELFGQKVTHIERVPTAAGTGSCHAAEPEAYHWVLTTEASTSDSASHAEPA